MKRLLLLLLLFVASFSNAQMNGRMNNGMNQGPPPSKDKKPFDFVEESVKTLTKQLSLDAFQAAVIKTYIQDYKKDIEALNVLDIPVEGKTERYMAAKDKMEAKILTALNKDQIVQFNEYKNRKDKKGKKGKKGKDENENSIIQKDSL